MARAPGIDVPSAKAAIERGHHPAVLTGTDGGERDYALNDAEPAEPESDMPSKQKRTRLEKLQNSWEKATVEERNQFLAWLRQDSPAGASPDLTTVVTPIASGRYLLPSAVTRIRVLMAKRGLTAGDVMAEIGFEPDDHSLTRALDENASLRLAIVAALELWLSAHSSTATSR